MFMVGLCKTRFLLHVRVSLENNGKKLLEAKMTYSKVSSFCKQVPKIELHAHLNGSLTAASLTKLGCCNEVVQEYVDLTNYLKSGKRDDRLKDCFKLFKIPHNATANKESVYWATKYVIEDFFDDNVIYLELRTTPRGEKDMTKGEYIETVVKAITECEFDIITKLLLSIDRCCDSKDAEETMQVIVAMKQKYPDIIKGVDFSGNPFVGSFNGDLFKTAVEAGLFTSLHCGERSNNNGEIRDMLTVDPNRIGHATFLHPKYGGCEDLWKLYRTKNIPLECCLTSNVSCGTTETYPEHHLQEWINDSLPFTLCTDDKGIFDTTLSEELELAMEHFNLDAEQIWNIMYRSVDFTFASDPEKKILREKLEDWKLKNQF